MYPRILTRLFIYVDWGTVNLHCCEPMGIVHLFVPIDNHRCGTNKSKQLKDMAYGCECLLRMYLGCLGYDLGIFRESSTFSVSVWIHRVRYVSFSGCPLAGHMLPRWCWDFTASAEGHHSPAAVGWDGVKHGGRVVDSFKQKSHGDLEVSWNGVSSKSSRLRGFSWILHDKPSSYWGIPIYGNPHMDLRIITNGLDVHEYLSNTHSGRSLRAWTSTGRYQGLVYSHYDIVDGCEILQYES